MWGFFKLLFPEVALISKHPPITPRKSTKGILLFFFKMNVNLIENLYGSRPIEVNEVILCVPADREGL